MGKCVVCSKSAGPFYSLHKKCLPLYQETRSCLQKALSSSESAETSQQLIESLRSCCPSTSFSQQQFNQLLLSAWQQQAKQIVKQSLVQDKHAKLLLDLADEFSIKPYAVEPFLFKKLQHIEYLAALEQGVMPSGKIDNVGASLRDDVTVLWVMNDVLLEVQKTQSEEKSWTVLQSILSNLMMKSRYKTLPVQTETDGKLIVTNQGIHYISNTENTRVTFSDIYSITPMVDGVRIQTNSKNAAPNTYVTGDGRFTYAVIRYAQEN